MKRRRIEPLIRREYKWDDLIECVTELVLHGLMQNNQAEAIAKACKRAKRFAERTRNEKTTRNRS